MEWINVKTELPKEIKKIKMSEKVLISDGKIVMESRYFYGKHPKWCYENTMAGITPTHWMPMPEPPSA